MAESIICSGKVGIYTLIILLSTLQLSLCAYETEVFQLLCIEDGGQLYGSKASSLNMIATHFAGNFP